MTNPGLKRILAGMRPLQWALLAGAVLIGALLWSATALNRTMAWARAWQEPVREISLDASEARFHFGCLLADGEPGHRRQLTGLLDRTADRLAALPSGAAVPPELQRKKEALLKELALCRKTTAEAAAQARPETRALHTAEELFAPLLREIREAEALCIHYGGKELLRFRRQSGVLTVVCLLAILAFALLLVRRHRKQLQTQQALRLSERNLAITLDSIGDGVVATDPEGRIVRMNPVAEELTGWRLDEAAGRPVQEVARLIHADSREPAENPVALALRSNIAVTLPRDIVLIGRDGRERRITDSAAPIHDAAGRVFGAVLVFRDETKILDQEERLRRSEARYRTYFENSNDAMLIIEGGRFADCNAAAIRLLGRTAKAEVVGKSPDELSPPFQPDGRHSAERAAEIMRATRERGGMVFEWNHLRRDGTMLPVEVSLTALREGDRIHVVWRDLTARKQTEQDLLQLAMAVEQSGEVIMITDAQGNIQYVNPEFENVTGYTRSEVRGRNPRILKSGRQSPEFYKEMWDTLLAGKTWSGRLINKRKDGALFTEEAAISPVIDADGRIINYVAAKSDVTHEADLEQQLRQAQKMEAVGQMAGGVAHDFNNLPQVICGYAELLQTDLPENDPAAGTLEEIQTAVQRGKKLVAQLLAFSRRQIMQLESVEVNEVIARLETMARGLMGLHVEWDFVPGRDVDAVKADRGQLEQVIINLCANSRDAMPEGGRLLLETANAVLDEEYVQTHQDVMPGRYVLIRITDTGCGMDRKTLDRIFDPFFTTKEVGRGTGLGLSVVYGIIKQHKGHIAVYSEPGHGTSFRIYLPAAPHRFSAAAESAPAPAPGGGETVLVAEDDAAVLRLAERTLRTAGYTVLTAGDGDAAVELFLARSEEIDMVLLDVMMPRLGGRAALEKMQAVRPGLPHLFASGYSGNTLYTDFIRDRDLNLLGKPYRSDELLRKVRAVLDAPPPPHAEKTSAADGK